MDSDFQDLNDQFEDVLKNTYDTKAGFRLFDLPPELWLRICEFAVTNPEPIEITRARKPADQARLVAQPAISRTCKLLRQESLKFFYKNNEFVAWHRPGVACIRHWFSAIGQQNVSSMQTFTFHAEYDDGFWKRSFEKMGLKVAVQPPSASQSQERLGWNLQTLTITFL